MRTLALLAWLASPPPVDGAADPAETVEIDVDEPAIDEPAIDEPAIDEPVDPDAATSTKPRPGGFGSVSSVTTESNVAVQPVVEDEAEAEKGPRTEASGRVSAGYGQTDVGNAQPWDHRGAALAAVLQWYPYLTKRRRFGVGVEIGYAYQGLVRRELPALADPMVEAPFTKSKVQQHFLDLGLALLMRPHPSWFSIQPTGALGVAFYTGSDLYAGDRHAGLAARSVAFGLAGSLALCTAWDIVCVVGGYRWTQRIDAVGALDAVPFQVPTSGWHAGLGLDILRVYARLNAQPAAR